MSDCIYLDYNASTPLEPRVLSAMQDIYSQTQVNAGSITHSLGRNAQAVVEEARAAVANSIQAEARDIVFCGGATEGINLALIGMARQYQSEGKHIICSSIEHRAVLAVLDQLETEGFEVSRLPVDKMGYVDPDVLKSAIRADTIICALIHVNNEIGTVQNL